MSDRVFLDTNVLVYAFDSDEPRKQSQALTVIESTGTQRTAVISTQVLREFYVTVTRKLQNPLGIIEAQKAVIQLTNLPVVQEDAHMILSAIEISNRYSLSLWDSLIIQAAIESDCRTLLTEDLQHGFTIGKLRVENPFLA